MFRQKRVVQNQVVARRMRDYFRKLTAEDRADPETVARRYGAYMFWNWDKELVVDKLSRPRFYVGISAGGSGHGFVDLTRRAVLVADTLLLAHDRTATYHELAVWHQARTTPRSQLDVYPPSLELTIGLMAGETLWDRREKQRNNKTTAYGMHCPDMRALGTWVLDAEPLLTAGLAWYLPSYSSIEYEMIDGVRHDLPRKNPQKINKTVTDYLIKDGRAVAMSGAEPIKSKLVRPVLHTELPFIRGVNMRTFSKITIDEFEAFTAFRDVVRLSLLNLDDALKNVQSDQEILKIGLQINDEVRAVHASMAGARSKRALSAGGAALGTVSTVLLAVYGPALATAITALGASGGIWDFINAMTDHSSRTLRQDKWYYVWVLADTDST